MTTAEAVTMSPQMKLPTDGRKCHFLQSIEWARPLGIVHRLLLHVLHILSKRKWRKAGAENSNTDFGMNDHFPTEINERRKKLSHYEKKALPEPTNLLGDE